MVLDVSALPLWRKVAQWLLVLPVSATALITAYMSSELLMVLSGGWVRAVDRSDLNLPIHGLLALQSVVEIFTLCVLWLMPTLFAIGFAAGWNWLTRIAAGLFAATVLSSVYVWTTQPGGSNAVPHTASITAVILLLIGAGLSFRRPRTLRPQLIGEAIAFLVLLVPSFAAITGAPRALASPVKLWTRTLQKGTWTAMNTGSEFAATRHLAFAGNRLVAVYESAMAPYQGKQPMAEYALISLDVKTGKTRDQRRFVGHWGATPSLYANRSGNLVVADSSLTELHSDLTNTASRFEVSRGRVEQMSPDGSTMAWETTPGITLLMPQRSYPRLFSPGCTARREHGTSHTSLTPSQFHISRIHPRMPVILHARDYDRWLDREETERLPLDLLRPYESDEMEVHEANPKVGNVRNNGPEMMRAAIQAAEDGELRFRCLTP